MTLDLAGGRDGESRCERATSGRRRDPRPSRGRGLAHGSRPSRWPHAVPAGNAPDRPGRQPRRIDVQRRHAIRADRRETGPTRKVSVMSADLAARSHRRASGEDHILQSATRSTCSTWHSRTASCSRYCRTSSGRATHSRRNRSSGSAAASRCRKLPARAGHARERLDSRRRGLRPGRLHGLRRS